MAKGTTGLALAAGAVAVAALAGGWMIWGQREAPGDALATQEAKVQTASPDATPEATPEPAPEAGTTIAADPAPADPAPADTGPADTGPAAEAGLPLEAPRFDVVRVDAGGLATVAGSAAPGGAVSLRVDGAEVAQVAADARGQFATVLTLTPSDLPRLLSLALVLPDGTEVAGVDTVALAPVPAPDPQPLAADAPEAEAGETPAEAAPAALLVTDEGVKVLQSGQPATAQPTLPLSIDSIAYGADDEVLLSGRATPGGALRIYLDDQPVAEVIAAADGDWQARLEAVAGGLHVLRVDEIDMQGKVLARFETPFKREVPVAALAEAPMATPETDPAADPSAVAGVGQAQPILAQAEPDPAPVAAPAPITITVQPGLTLWAIARENFGDGMMYVQVFEANRDKIKDPDLIYPGQVFTVPKP